MKSRLDQLEQELTEWDDRELRYEKLFKTSVKVNRTLQKEKLAVFERLEIKYGGNGHDSTGHLLLRERRREIERMIYPTPFSRLLYRLAKAIRSNGRTFAYEKAIQSNLKTLHQQVSRSGFKISESRLEQIMRQGNREAVVPVSYYVNQSEKMDFELKFSKDENGTYLLDQYHAKYQNISGDKEVKACSFNGGHSSEVTAKQAYNLLAGRAAFVENEPGDRQWIQLDFNDKDATGNYRVKVFNSDYGFDLAASLDKIELNETMNYFSKLKLVASLENGDRVSVTQGVKQIEIEASPQRQKLNVYENGMLKLGKTDNENVKELKLVSVRPKMDVVKPARVKGLGK